MTPALALRLVVDPTLDWMESLGVRSDGRARLMLLSIAGQESAFRWRAQVPVAHAKGWWQFEWGGGVKGVLTHAGTRAHAAAVCAALAVPATPEAVHVALEQNDALACAFARLLLLSDPRPLPVEPNAGWDYYVRNWRPGKPYPGTWAGHWRAALEAMAGPAVVAAE